MMKTKLNIYVHVPFCESKCVYCNFTSFCNKKDEMDKYFNFLIEEIKNSPYKGEEVQTIYIGGGTPTAVNSNYLKAILDAIHETFKVDKFAEISMEANPNSVTDQKLKIGVNRVSFGVQSVYSKDLKKLNRIHSKKDIFYAIKLAKNAGIKNINTDILLGLEGQTSFRVIKEIKKLIKMGIKHISCYMLMIEEGTPLFTLVKEGKYKPLSDDKTVLIYEKVEKFLRKKKYYRYEVSNFANVGYECKHNVNIWKGENYLGFGLSAHGKYDDVRQYNPDNFKEYYSHKNNVEKLSDKELVEEYIMLHLRLFDGINLDAFKEKFGYDLLSGKDINEMIALKKIKIEGGRLFVLDFGVLNSIILRLI